MYINSISNKIWSEHTTQKLIASFQNGTAKPNKQQDKEDTLWLTMEENAGRREHILQQYVIRVKQICYRHPLRFYRLQHVATNTQLNTNYDSTKSHSDKRNQNACDAKSIRSLESHPLYWAEILHTSSDGANTNPQMIL